MTHTEYMRFFERWLQNQFPREESDWDNYEVLKVVAKIVADPEELTHWAERTCWAMYDLAKEQTGVNRSPEFP